MTEKQVILIRGLPGSGKSTLAKQLCIGSAGVHLEADQFFVDYYTGKYHFKPEKIKEAHGYCFKRFQIALSEERIKKIVVSNTFTQLWEMQPYFTACDVHSIRPQIIHCEGRFENIHGVSEDKIEQMRARWEPMP